jgi:hypothetical protein
MPDKGLKKFSDFMYTIALADFLQNDMADFAVVADRPGDLATLGALGRKLKKE